MTMMSCVCEFAHHYRITSLPRGSVIKVTAVITIIG
jgi:hypothetical protein